MLSFSAAYNHGSKIVGNNTPEVGAVYSLLGSGAFSASSNRVNVATVRLLSVTSNQTIVNPGNTVTVTLQVRNTGTFAMNIQTAGLRFYRTPFQTIAIGSPDNYRLDTQNAFVITPPALPAVAAGATAFLSFTVQVTNNLTAFSQVAYNPVILDGYLAVNIPPVITDAYWTAAAIINGQYQYAADVTANWDLSGPPRVISIAVTPNPTRINPVIITVNFSEAMNTGLPASINYRFNGVTRNIVGNWFNATTWVGNFNIPAGTVFEGLATVAALRATSNLGEAIIPSYNVGQFEIDTIKPTASLVMGTQANIAAVFPLQFVATDILRVTPSVGLNFRLSAGGSATVNVNFVSSNARVTWNGQVVVPVTALVGSIATFNVIGFYMDNAGNTNNIILGRVTVNLAAAVPVISTVNFDSVPAYNGLNISAEPAISLFVIDYKKVGINPASIRVTVDGVLVNCAPYAISIIYDLAYRVYQIDFNFPYALSNGSHTFTFGLSDLDVPPMPATPYTVTVIVTSQDLELIEGPIPFPNPFSPDGDGVDDFTEIVYELNKSSDMIIYIYDLNGDVVWRKDIAKGDQGGRAGVNRVVWNGEATFGRGEVLSNGIYICHVIAEIDGEKRSLGRTKIYILK